MHAKMTRDRKKMFISSIEKTIQELENENERMKHIISRQSSNFSIEAGDSMKTATVTSTQANAPSTFSNGFIHLPRPMRGETKVVSKPTMLASLPLKHYHVHSTGEIVKQPSPKIPHGFTIIG